MHILVTAFDPFGGLDTNSSMMVLEKLNDTVGDIKIEKLIVPTVYTECARIAWEKANEKGMDMPIGFVHLPYEKARGKRAFP